MADAELELTTVANFCSTGSCPTVYQDKESGTVIAQGYIRDSERWGMNTPDDAVVIEIPIALMQEALRNLK